MSENGHAPGKRRVILHRDGSGQVLHIPRDIEFDTLEAIIYREGDRIVIEPAGEPVRRKTLAEVLDELEPLGEEDAFDFGELDRPLAPRQAT